MKLIDLTWVDGKIATANEVEYKNEKFAAKLLKQHEGSQTPRFITPEKLPQFGYKPVKAEKAAKAEPAKPEEPKK